MATSMVNPAESSPFLSREQWTCYVCGTTEPKGVPVRWVRSGPDVGKKYHPSCTPAPVAAAHVAAPAAPAAGSGDALAGLLAGALLPHIQEQLHGKVDAAAVRDIAQAMIDEQFPMMAQAVANTLRKEFTHTTTLELRNPVTGETKALGVQHKEFPVLLDAMQARRRDKRLMNIWLTGPTGSGKTTGVMKAAEALGRRFAFCGAMDTPYQLMGYIDAHGNVVKTEFRDFVLNGGAFLGDEIDSWAPAAQLALNAVITNGKAAFPDGTYDVHPDFQFIGAANTWGLGATSDYVGRSKLDAAFLARFPLKIDWFYDDDMELGLSGNPEWCKRVQKLRANAKRQGLKVIIHPRYTYEGAALLAIGWDMAKVERYTIAAGLKPEQWEAIR